MKVLFRKELKELLERPRGLGASVYMPSRHTGDTLEGPLRLGNLLETAEKKLIDAGMRPVEARALLAPATALRTDAEFWKQQGEGLAVFVFPGAFRHYLLPFPTAELVEVSDRFHIAPLVQLFSKELMFYVLALSQNSVRLLQCTPGSVRAVTPENVPASLADHLRYDSQERQVQFHSGGHAGSATGRGAVVFHGQAGGTDWNKDSIVRFFAAVDRGLHELLHDQQAPLIIAGVAFLHPLYRQVNTYPHLLHDGIEGNPDDMTAKTLQQKCLTIASSYFEGDKTKALNMYMKRAGSGQTTNDLGRVVTEAHDGHVFKLFVAPDAQIWGTYDPQGRTVTVHEKREAGDTDLVDLAAVRTLLSGGSLYTLDDKKVVGGAPVAAVLRFAEAPASAA